MAVLDTWLDKYVQVTYVYIRYKYIFIIVYLVSYTCTYEIIWTYEDTACGSLDSPLFCVAKKWSKNRIDVNRHRAAREKSRKQYLNAETRLHV